MRHDLLPNYFGHLFSNVSADVVTVISSALRGQQHTFCACVQWANGVIIVYGSIACMECRDTAN